MTVEEMKAVDIRTVDRETLVDIRDVKIDRSLPPEERARSFVEQIKNPYCFRCGEAVVKVAQQRAACFCGLAASRCHFSWKDKGNDVKVCKRIVQKCVILFYNTQA